VPRLESITEINKNVSVKLKNYINDIPLQAKIAETEIGWIFKFRGIFGTN